jgi:hypothetical protein
VKREGSRGWRRVLDQGSRERSQLDTFDPTEFFGKRTKESTSQKMALRMEKGAGLLVEGEKGTVQSTVSLFGPEEQSPMDRSFGHPGPRGKARPEGFDRDHHPIPYACPVSTGSAEDL